VKFTPAILSEWIIQGSSANQFFSRHTGDFRDFLTKSQKKQTNINSFIQ
jgi:hypothetical protein